MKAAEARALKVGDWVRACFGLHDKPCEIIAINWPTFTLKTKDYKGEEMIRTRRYQSLWGRCEPDGPPTTKGLPSWLEWPQQAP